MDTNNNIFSPQEIEKLSENISLVDYFHFLEKQGKVVFERKTGHDFYFRTPENKFSVSHDGFYDFKSGEGGQIIKAIMTLENKSWKDAVKFLREFSGFENLNVSETNVQYRKTSLHQPPLIINSVTPNNDKLIQYFENRGISKGVLQYFTKQIHFKIADKTLFGIGIENVSNGWEIRNPLMKTKIGENDISEVRGNKNELIVFEGMTDTLSFFQLLKSNQLQNNRSIVTLNSVTNVGRFLQKYEHYEGKIFLCLDGDEAGNSVTQKILNEFKNKNIQDIRSLYNISEKGNKDLNDYLQYKVKIQSNNIRLTKENLKTDERNLSKSKSVSHTSSLGRKSSEQYLKTVDKDVQSEQEIHHPTRQDVHGEIDRNGPAVTTRGHLGARSRGGHATRTQQNDDSANERTKDSLVRGLVENSTNILEVDELIQKYKGQRLKNEQVEEVVSASCFVSDDQQILLKENLNITRELKDICSQFKSGGVAKEGRGILDEYYTDIRIAESVRNLIKDLFKNHKEIHVLEPSIGLGNFLYAAKELNVTTKIVGFEINDTTAKIAKLLHPETEIFLRPFEREFIDEKGHNQNKESFSEKYDLVIGNPPYGEHRGLYKGLGEEPKISKYEDYFVKRSLDSLKPNGILAMVLPSGWLNRQKKLENANLIQAFRLPSGAFAGTRIGTDIIILKKSEAKNLENISTYFEDYPQRILGEIRQKTNRFGKLEYYVHGDLDQALFLLEKFQHQKEQIRIGNLFEDYYPESTVQTHTNLGFIQKQKDDENVLSKLIDDAKTNIDNVLNVLSLRKFKSLSLQNEIAKYESLADEINNKPQSFSSKQLQELIDKSSKIIQTHNAQLSEYEFQKFPIIKKGILKYHFSKSDEIVGTAFHNNPNISKEEMSAFMDTNYDGTINNFQKHLQFANYYKGAWIHDFYYAEGNIYEKLEQLELDFKDNLSTFTSNEQYEKQKKILKNVLPVPKNIGEIMINANHEFVHQFNYGDSERNIYNYDKKVQETVIQNLSLAEKFKDFVGTLSSDAFLGSSMWEVRSFVDNEMVTGSDKERNALVRERRKIAANDLFKKFIHEELSAEMKERFVKEFNRNFNHVYVPDYSKFPLFSKIHKNFKGSPLQLTEVQKAGIGRLTTKGVGLLAHEVGFGKTLSGILSLHEAMQRGNAKRPLVVVPNNNILKQWVETIFETIPDAKVNVLGNLGKDYDLSHFDNKDGEITIITYEGFNNIGFSEEITQSLASKFSYISENELKSANVISERHLQIELQKEKELEGKMKRGKIYDWEDFGFDHLTFDEVHNANHIVGKVRIEDRRFASDFRNQNQQTSKLGINAWMACQFIQDRNDGRNVSLLSATPFTNKPLEYYSILSLIANKRLEESGYFNVNNFFETFMEADNDMEIDAKGDVKYKASIRRFKNNSLFQQLLSEFIDMKGEEDNPELIRPTRINKEYRIEQNDLTKEQYEHLNESFSETEKGAILTHILNARLIAISPYISPYYQGGSVSVKEFIENSPKLKLTMGLIRQNKIVNPNAGQIIYSELAVAEFPKLKDYLINEIGYTKEEVGMITGATSKNKRIEIQNDFNLGKIKIVIGSEAIQEGMNLQENTSDLYLLSLPYNFTSLRQVEGRAWRQGNKFENVRINFMLTNDSIDVFMLQKLQSKQARYLEAMKKGANVLDVSDINTQELKTSIITSPETRANIEIQLMKKRIENEKNKYLADNAFVLRKYADFLNMKEKLNGELAHYNRIKSYAEGDEPSEYWSKVLPNYEAKVTLVQNELDQVIERMAQKGVNVVEIESQTKATEEKIIAFDELLDNLPNVQSELILKYENEKVEKLKNKETFDYINDRQQENKDFFRNENFHAEIKSANGRLKI
ncbi:toprim domain-containing protein [Cloacibacterium normanense]|uniref:toprim domain-containing protein n=1 Tax=Cloacibacterium normanense TaxID=237258 RepID=UPI00391D776C